MEKVFYVETTTDGRTLLHCSSGDNTADVEVIEFPNKLCIEKNIKKGEWYYDLFLERKSKRGYK